MINELKQIHDFLMQVSVSGEDTIKMGESIIRLRRVIDKLQGEAIKPEEPEE